MPFQLFLQKLSSEEFLFQPHLQVINKKYQPNFRFFNGWTKKNYQLQHFHCEFPFSFSACILVCVGPQTSPTGGWMFIIEFLLFSLGRPMTKKVNAIDQMSAEVFIFLSFCKEKTLPLLFLKWNSKKSFNWH